jgi:hypothetical protein
MSKKATLQEQHDNQARERRVCNLRLQVISLAMSQKIGKYTLSKMIKAGEEGKREERKKDR